MVDEGEGCHEDGRMYVLPTATAGEGDTAYLIDSPVLEPYLAA